MEIQMRESQGLDRGCEILGKRVRQYQRTILVTNLVSQSHVSVFIDGRVEIDPRTSNINVATKESYR
jgi:hypothetical protein